MTLRFASRVLGMLVCLFLAPFAVLAFLVAGSMPALSLVVACVSAPFIAMNALLKYPASLAAKRASSVLADSPEATNLMIMSLRHDSSVSKAISFASRRTCPFSRELKECVWGVVMGRYSGFEEALHGLGRRWGRFSSELTTSMDALVTASRESTQEGRRRALDRANNAMISGAKRRIEEYALSLSGPSMVMFALGILLPLIVGSFLPMLSWNLWSLDSAGQKTANTTTGSLALETAFLMNVLFPAIALIVAMNAISRHPMNARAPARWGELLLPTPLAVSVIVSVLSVTGASIILTGSERFPALILGIVCPASAYLLLAGRKAAGRPSASPADLDEALFRTGARMLEGENFEAALGHAGERESDDGGGFARALSYRSNVVGQGFDEAYEMEGRRNEHIGSNAASGMKIVRDAATKDELEAGMLAMDLSAYLKDLHEIESSLKARLKPTVSMMKMTTFALGPVVMGITFAIYLSLATMTGGEGGGGSAGTFMLLLGGFLAETDLVIGYFVWGIEGKEGLGTLAGSVGLSLMSSELIFVATTTLAA